MLAKKKLGSFYLNLQTPSRVPQPGSAGPSTNIKDNHIDK
jgi:hypothetical protein